MTAVITRILLRYLSGALIAAGWLGEQYDLSADPDVIMVVGLGIGAATEAVYAYAKRMGWTT